MAADADTGGPSTHIATDMWTLNDSLGYRAYAYAIYRFMLHPQTKPPLTISIQASWGGGKTSLMRMIQQALDPKALKEVEQEETQDPRAMEGVERHQAKTVRGMLTRLTARMITYTRGQSKQEATQDPEAPEKVEQNTTQLRGEITVKDALSEVDDLIQNTEKDLPPVPSGQKRELLTVWFNAWKYESTKEVWAGLAHAIIEQVAARLPLLERERFYLRLNFKRVDGDQIRQRIYERVFRYWWRGVTKWGVPLAGLLFVSILTALMAWLTGLQILQVVGWSGISLSTLGSGIVAIWKYIGAKRSVEAEPAAVSLGDYLDIPSYSMELGFIHHVEADLRRVLSSVPQQRLPIVIFIDDLDRCSPAKVAQVVEGVNLFLGGEFSQCMFVIGMDAEMVAAALQAAHRDMIAGLPKDAGIPVGWRFMDKFVQLPFLIPPTEGGGLARYTSALFSTGDDQPNELMTEQLAGQVLERVTSMAAVRLEAERLQREHNLDEIQAAHLRDQMEARLVQRTLEEGIQKFSDKNPEIRRVIGTAIPYFRGNPRELKRFINAFRFHYFLWWAHRAQELQGPTLEQLLRWTVLSMRWPEVVRWLRRSGGIVWGADPDGTAPKGKAPVSLTRLKLIEEISGEATDIAAWQQQARKVFHLTPIMAPWLNDDELFRFFQAEATQQPEGQRLSDGVGKGLW
jgi:hypothetical protein